MCVFIHFSDGATWCDMQCGESRVEKRTNFARGDVEGGEAHCKSASYLSIQTEAFYHKEGSY